MEPDTSIFLCISTIIPNYALSIRWNPFSVPASSVSGILEHISPWTKLSKGSKEGLQRSLPFRVSQRRRGSKYWVLAVNGYILDFLWHARGSNKRDGPQNLDPRWKKEGFCATQAVVLTLLLRMKNNGHGHVVWIDNLFTSARLLQKLRESRIGAAGTVRTTNRKREEIDTNKTDDEDAEDTQQATEQATMQATV